MMALRGEMLVLTRQMLAERGQPACECWNPWRRPSQAEHRAGSVIGFSFFLGCDEHDSILDYNE